MTDFNIIPANKEHLPGIYSLVELNVRRKSLLPRSRFSIQASLPDWVVAVKDNSIIGCGSLLSYVDGMAEVRSLAIADVFHGQGVGTSIVSRLVENARERGMETVFALTTAVSLFRKSGFSIVPIHCFPDKVIQFCASCPKRHACDETAVVFQLADTPFQCQELKNHSLSNLNLSVLPQQVGLSK